MIAAVMTGAAFLVTDIPAVQNNADKERPGEDNRIDWIGAGLISSSLMLLLISLTQGDSLGWKTHWVPPLIVVSILGLCAFVLVEWFLERRGTLQPLLRVSMFHNLQFSVLFILVGAFYASYNSFLVFVTYFYQDYLGLGVLQTALRFLPSGVTGIIASFIVSPVLSCIPGFYVLIFGLLCGLGSPLLFAVPIPPNTIYWAWGFPALCLCMSVEVVWPVLGLLIAKKLRQQDQALGAAMLQTVSQISRSLGLVISTAVQTAVEGMTDSDSDTEYMDADYLRGLRAAQWMNVGLVIVSIILAAAFLRQLERI
ncbi:hypothetical protein N7490_002090 [Penicillium lividum]|nr:hypothetical protein N7490_002090 [Penicillium lividum]